MSIVRADRKRILAFTLLEITLAVTILAMMSFVIYRFVQTNIVAMRVSAAAEATDAAYDGLRELLRQQLQNIPPGTGALLGDALKVNDRDRDEVTWLCSAGPGLGGLSGRGTGRVMGAGYQLAPHGFWHGKSYCRSRSHGGVGRGNCHASCNQTRIAESPRQIWSWSNLPCPSNR